MSSIIQELDNLLRRVNRLEGVESINYSSGTWVPAFTNLTVVGTPTYTGRYTRIGKIVHFVVTITATTSTASTAGSTYLNNLPIAAAYASVCVACENTVVDRGNGYIDASNKVYLPTWAASAYVITVSGWYEVA